MIARCSQEPCQPIGFSKNVQIIAVIKKIAKKHQFVLSYSYCSCMIMVSILRHAFAKNLYKCMYISVCCV